MTAVFEVSGTIDFETALALRKKGDRWIEEKENLVVDFKTVDRCNSAGLAVMTAWLRHAKRLQKKICFVNVPSSLQMIATVCGVTEILGMKLGDG